MICLEVMSMKSGGLQEGDFCKGMELEEDS